MAKRFIRVLHNRVRSVQPRELPLTFDEKQQGMQLIEIDDDTVITGDAWPRVQLDPNAPDPPRDPHAPPEVKRGYPDSNSPEGQYDPPRGDPPRQPKPDPNAPRPASESPSRPDIHSTKAEIEAEQERGHAIVEEEKKK